MESSSISNLATLAASEATGVGATGNVLPSAGADAAGTAAPANGEENLPFICHECKVAYK